MHTDPLEICTVREHKAKIKTNVMNECIPSRKKKPCTKQRFIESWNYKNTILFFFIMMSYLHYELRVLDSLIQSNDIAGSVWYFLCTKHEKDYKCMAWTKSEMAGFCEGDTKALIFFYKEINMTITIAANSCASLQPCSNKVRTSA